MADLFGGDAIRHALGILVFGREGECNGEGLQKYSCVAARNFQLRCLIIDDIGMVRAMLFADVDLKLRQLVRSIGTSTADRIDCSFGGSSMLCSV